MSSHSDNNKRLAKNTLFLYGRTLFIMLVSLYTTRVTLQVLGVEDFGVYNVVGGVVAILATINGAMSGASSRFISFSLGKNESSDSIGETFSTIRITHWILALLVLLLGESIGLWFVAEKLVIPEGREVSAMVCYQCSLLAALVSIINVPYNATIIGHERMDAYAYFSIVDAVLRLASVFLLMAINYDKLIVYSVLMLIAQILIFECYKYYSNHYFLETNYRLCWNKKMFGEIASFAGWTFTGQFAFIGYTQGINILMNIFFGPVVNAARGVSVQVQNAARILVNNFQIAIRPQMIKSWAQGEHEYMHKLVVYSTRLSFYLTTLTVFPLLFTIKPLLHIWLGEVPEHTVAFVEIILYSMLADAFCHGMIVSIHATGKIAKFQIWESASLLTVVPIAYILLKVWNISAEQVMWVYFFVQIFTQIIRMYIVLPRIKMKWSYYLKNVFPRVLAVLAILLIPSLMFKISEQSSFLYTTLSFMGNFLFVCLVIIFVGLKQEERKIIKQYISKFIRR